MGMDTLTANGGEDVILGDNGLLNYNVMQTRTLTTTGLDLTGDGDWSTLDLIQSTQLDQGAADTLSGNGDDDTILGGGGGDTITGDDGQDYLLGDNGELVLVGGQVALVRTTDTVAGTGGDDTITGNAGDDVILGGVGSDSLTGNVGADVILGDNGLLNYNVRVVDNLTGELDLTGDDNLNSLDLILSTELGLGSTDTIEGNDGDDIILGGADNDTITGGSGGDVIFGDNGEVIQVGGGRIETSMEGGAAASEFQTLEVIATGGSFTLTFGTDTTTALAHDASAADIEAALTALAGLDAGDVTVTGGERRFQIAFAGALAMTNVAPIRVDNSNLLGERRSLARTLDTMAATGGDDLINGYFGVEVVCGDENVPDDDYIFGGVGADDIRGNLGDDTILGDNGLMNFDTGDGDGRTLDLVQSYHTGPGALGDSDTVRGGAGVDFIVGGFAGDELFGNAGSDIIIGDNGEIVLASVIPAGALDTSDPRNVVSARTTDVSGATGGNDIIRGDFDTEICDTACANNGDVILAGVGADTVNSDWGEDVVIGDDGFVDFAGNKPSIIKTGNPNLGEGDTIIGGDCDDTLIGGAGGDDITDLEDNNLIVGDFVCIDVNNFDLRSLNCVNGSDDVITTGLGNDTVIGGGGNDRLTNAGGDSILFGDCGHVGPGVIEAISPPIGGVDTITSGNGDDSVMGGAQGDIITISGGNNVAFGDAGLILGGTDINTLEPGTGGADRIDTGGGNDTVIGGAAGDDITTAGGNDVVLGDSGNVQGTSASSDAPGTGGADDINSGGGNDTVIGGAAGDDITSAGGDDVVLGDSGTAEGGTATSEAPGTGGGDNIDAGAGDDSIIGGAAGDDIDAGDDDDKVLGDSGVSNGRSVRFTAERTGGDDNISGGGGDDAIVAGIGDDDADGGGGDDTLLGDNGVITFVGGAVQQAQTDFPDLGGDDTLGGGGGDDNVLGGQGDDLIDGGGGDDFLIGDNGTITLFNSRVEPSSHDIGGSDTISGGSGNDVLIGGAQADRLAGDSGSDVLIGDNGLVLTNGRTPYFIVSPNIGFGWGDFLDGGPGHDFIIGGEGDDTLVGNLGEDILIGDFGRIFIENGIVISVEAFGGHAAGDLSSALDRATAYVLYSNDLAKAGGSNNDGLLSLSGGSGASQFYATDVFGDSAFGHTALFRHNHGAALDVALQKDLECAEVKAAEDGQPVTDTAVTTADCPADDDTNAADELSMKVDDTAGTPDIDADSQARHSDMPEVFIGGIASMAALGWQQVRSRRTWKAGGNKDQTKVFDESTGTFVTRDQAERAAQPGLVDRGAFRRGGRSR